MATASAPGREVDGRERLRHRRERLHGRAHPDRLPGAHAALDAAGPLRAPADGDRRAARSRRGPSSPAGPRSRTRRRTPPPSPTGCSSARAARRRIELAVVVHVRPEARAGSRRPAPRTRRRACRGPSGPRRSRPPSRAAAAGSRQRTGDASTASRSSGSGRGARAGTAARPIRTTWESDGDAELGEERLRDAARPRRAPPSRARSHAPGRCGRRRTRTSARPRGPRAPAGAG